MKLVPYLLLLGFAALCGGQNKEPRPQNATTAVLRAFDDHNIVMLGEAHGCKQEYEWLRELVNAPEFADRVDDIVVEFGNSLYQKSVDRYIAGEDIPFVQVQQAWRNTIGAVGPPSPVYESFYREVREVNLKRRGKHQLRIVLGDPYIDWDTIKDREEIAPFLANRDSWYAQVVKAEVLNTKRRALLIMGGIHFMRSRLPSPASIEQQLLAAGASTYLIEFDNPLIDGYDDREKRLGGLPLPAIVDLRANWMGDMPVGETKLADAADALLFVATRDALTKLFMPRAELEGTAYGRELDRRSTIQIGRTVDVLSHIPEGATPEGPLFDEVGDGPPPGEFFEIKSTPLPPRPAAR
jgi:hypothetical protein